MGEELSDEAVLKGTNFCSKWSDVIELIFRFKDIGVSQIVLPSGPDIKKIRTYATKILKEFR